MTAFRSRLSASPESADTALESPAWASGEGAHAREGQRVDEELERALDELAQPRTQRLRPAVVHGVPDDEGERAGERQPLELDGREKPEDARVEREEPEVLAQEPRPLAAPERAQRVQQEPRGE